ncbi:tellurite resistance protein TerA [Rhodococcus sp. OK519]|uniref:TerD family protein n=1 Tax=Rhodococcus sp. OK519 TaxID=2135729 RepID=UPI000D339039|nr:tellurite resistance protein TerA [Rhodococcus sp. OK519]
MAIDYTRRPNTPPAGAAPQGGVNLSKISLTKSAPSVSLTKAGERQGTMRVNLNWSQTQPEKKGFFAKLSGGGRVDLDLACLFELTDGSKGVIQALGNSFGSLNTAPFIQLDGDDRSGSVSGGENMHINLDRPEMIRRVLIFAMIYEGAPNWAAVDGVVTLYPTVGPQIEVRLDSADNNARICAIAMLENNGSGITVNRLVNYINGSQSDLDAAYGWGMQWQAGRK